MKFTMLIGIPASGKSFVANGLQATNGGIILSSDEIRCELYGDETIQGDPKDVFCEMEKRTLNALQDGISVIYDATNISSKHRKNILQKISKFSCEKIAYVIATPIDECKRNNINRERKVPTYVIDKMYKSFQFPMESEGFDIVDIIYNSNDYYNYTHSLLNKKDGWLYYDQRNKHHECTLGNHLLNTYNYIIKNYNNCNRDVAIAGLLHDIGKPFVCTMTDIHGNPTCEAHYYDHQNVSSYEAMFYLRDKTMNLFQGLTAKDYVYICQLIANHMMPYFWKYDKTKEKYKRTWGDGFYNDIMILHSADVYSHKDSNYGTKETI